MSVWSFLQRVFGGRHQDPSLPAASAPKAESRELWRPPVGEPVIAIHEDDWGMRNLWPALTGEHAVREMGESIAAAERNRDPSGFGWTAMHEIQSPDVTFRDIGLTAAAAEAAIDGIMPRVRWFSATVGLSIGQAEKDPWGSYEEDALCFGFDRSCFIKLDCQDGMVVHIWFEATGDATQLAALRAAIEAVDRISPAVIADFWIKAVGPVSDTYFMDRYFAHLAG